MLFNVHSDLATGEKDFFEMNPGARAIKVYNKCSSRQMFFVCLVADRDHDSPYRTLPERTRRERAVVTAGWPMEGTRPDKNARNLISGKVEAVEAAIVQYTEDQYDEDRAMLDAVNAQIQDAIAAMAADKQAIAKVIKITTNKKTGTSTTEEYIDAKTLAILQDKAVNLGTKLPALKKAKADLMQSMRLSSPLDNVNTYSSQDIDSAEEIDFGDDEGSTLDRQNERLKAQKTL